MMREVFGNTYSNQVYNFGAIEVDYSQQFNPNPNPEGVNNYGYYLDLYQKRKTEYFELQNQEIPDYLSVVAAEEKKPEYKGMTVEKLKSKQSKKSQQGSAGIPPHH